MLNRLGTLVLCSTLVLPAQDSMITDSLHASAIGRTKKFTVLLPSPYDTSHRYPVLYLLHGHDGGYRDWVARTNLASTLAGIPLIVILPDGDNSWYVNSATDQNLRYEDYIVHDLRGHVQRKYAVDTSRQAVAGLSMGGYGALLYGLKHPRVFKFAGSLSGAFIFPTFLEDTVRQPVGRHLRTSLLKAFGPRSHRVRVENDLFVLLDRSTKDTLPYVYMATGIQDAFKGFIPAHRMFADSLRSRGIAYEYHETPGTHSWPYWGREIRHLILRMRHILQF